MILSLVNHGFDYETEKLSRIFFPGVDLTVGDVPADGDFIMTEMQQTDSGKQLIAEARIGEKTARAQRHVENDVASEKNCERAIALALFDVLSELTGYKPAWGILTGVRPAKLMSRSIAELGEKGAVEHFTKNLLVSEDKAKLAAAVSSAESAIVASSQPNSFSLYIDIPFCPTRCSYCSFISHSNLSAKKADTSICAAFVPGN